jgi:hypothetical protein
MEQVVEEMGDACGSVEKMGGELGQKLGVGGWNVIRKYRKFRIIWEYNKKK